MTRWKYDTDPHDPLVALRIPVTSKWPVFSYLAALHRDGHRPTDREAMMLAMFIRSVRLVGYPREDREAMAAEPFDIHQSASTVIFHKYLRDDWGYRLSTWQTGSAFAPPSPHVSTRTTGPLPLTGVLSLAWSAALGGKEGQPYPGEID